MRRALRSGGLVLLVVVSFAAAWVRLPYYALGPGPAREVLPLIRVDGAQTFASGGRFVMTTVRFRPITTLGAIAAWLDPEQSVVEEDVLYPAGLTAREEQRRATSEMDTSKIDAAAVVLSKLTRYPREHGRGALIERVGEGCPADGALFPGDLIVRIDGEAVRSVDDASAAIDRLSPGEPAAFRVVAEGDAHDVRVARGRCPGEPRPLVGISLVEPFPFEISMESDDVGGPSAGLMWALALYDLLTPGDLTDGRTVAGTGAIDGEGHVGPIGGVSDKVVAAREVGADILFVPEANASELRGVDRGGVRVVAVATFDEALEVLEASERSG
jgi:Lon-like protease